MLERVRIRDVALVDEADLALAPGLNVVTGETGAGKSLLVQSVGLLIGARADSDVVRDGAGAASVEGEFRLEGELARRVGELLNAWDLDFDGETLIVRREVGTSGRSRATVNQSPVTQAALRRLGEILADLHGQHEHQSLLREGAGLETLDRLAGLDVERARYADALAAYREAAAERERVEASLSTYAERRDYLMHAARELGEARLEDGEDERLRGEASRLRHADRLRALVAGALERLSEGEGAARDAIAAATHLVDQAAALDPGLDAHRPALEDARIACGEVGRALAEYAAALDADPQALEDVEARRETLASLSRKYRRSIAELIGWHAELERELAAGEDASGTLDQARARMERAAEACGAAGAGLSRARQAAAGEWSRRVSRDLKPLGLGEARLDFVVEPAGAGAAGFGPAGLDEVRIQFTANPGEPARPLQRIASGGELSRVMLALKTALEARDRVDLLLFDEVDSGIGGAVAHAVGERLRSLSRHRQVVCVTHLPMIAALASHHLQVTKHVAGGRTVCRMAPVRGEARVAELARMLAGDRASETTRRQARELIEGPPARRGAR